MRFDLKRYPENTKHQPQTLCVSTSSALRKTQDVDLKHYTENTIRRHLKRYPENTIRHVDLKRYAFRPQTLSGKH
jgi:hypothetical protein